MNRKQKALEERFRNEKKSVGTYITKDKRKYYPTHKPDPFRVKRDKLAQLLAQSDETIAASLVKNYAATLLREAESFQTLQEWADYDPWAFLTNITSQGRKPTKIQQLTWDVHSGLAFTKLYNSIR